MRSAPCSELRSSCKRARERRICRGGLHVPLPAGTTLTFVLSQSPARRIRPMRHMPPLRSPQHLLYPPPACSGSGGASDAGPLTAMEICFSNPPPNPSDLNYRTEFLTAVFEVPVETLRSIPVLEPAFSDI